MPDRTSKIYSAAAFRRPSYEWTLPSPERSKNNRVYSTGDEVLVLTTLDPETLSQYLKVFARRKSYDNVDPEAVLSAGETLLNEHKEKLISELSNAH